MFNKGQKVKVKPYQRTRSIFGPSEAIPSRIRNYKGGWAGYVTGIFKDDNSDEPIFEVTEENATGRFADFSLSELEKI